MDLFILKLVIVLIATGISAYTDFKTVYIYDWLTYPFIAIGLVFTFVEGTYVMGLLFAALIFCLEFCYIIKARSVVEILSSLPAGIIFSCL
jgi:prepilin signal peptidase PulO-like enzyme (type II secretory pathway)